MRDEIPDFPSNLPLINAENHLNSDTLEDRKVSWYQFFFSVQEEFFVFSNKRKATMYFKCMCMFFSFDTNFFKVFFFISKFLTKMKIVKLFPNLNFVVDSETYLLFYSLFKTFVYSLNMHPLYFHLIHP